MHHAPRYARPLQHRLAATRDYRIMRRSWWLALAACGRLHFNPTTDADAVCTGPHLVDVTCPLLSPEGVCVFGGTGCAGEACVPIEGPRCVPSIVCSCADYLCVA